MSQVEVFLIGPKEGIGFYTNSISSTKRDAQMKMLVFLERHNNPPFRASVMLGADGRYAFEEVWDMVKDEFKCSIATVDINDDTKIYLGHLLDEGASQEVFDMRDECATLVELGAGFNLDVFTFLAQERAEYLWSIEGFFWFKEPKHAARAKLIFG